MKRQKSVDVLSGLYLQYVGLVSTVIKSVPACCARKTAEFIPFDSVRKRRWSCICENVSPTEDLIASDAMNARFFSNSIVRTGKYYRLSIWCEADFLKELVLQEIMPNQCSEMFSSTEE